MGGILFRIQTLMLKIFEKINTLNKNSDAIIKYIDHNISLTALLVEL